MDFSYEAWMLLSQAVIIFALLVIIRQNWSDW